MKSDDLRIASHERKQFDGSKVSSSVNKENKGCGKEIKCLEVDANDICGKKCGFSGKLRLCPSCSVSLIPPGELVKSNNSSQSKKGGSIPSPWKVASTSEDKDPYDFVSSQKVISDSGSDFKLSDKSWFIGHEQHNYIDRGKGEVLGIEDVKEFILRLKKEAREDIRESCAYQLLHRKPDEDPLDLLVDWLCHKIDKLSGDFK